MILRDTFPTPSDSSETYSEYPNPTLEFFEKSDIVFRCGFDLVLSASGEMHVIEVNGSQSGLYGASVLMANERTARIESVFKNAGLVTQRAPFFTHNLNQLSLDQSFSPYFDALLSNLTSAEITLLESIKQQREGILFESGTSVLDSFYRLAGEYWNHGRGIDQQSEPGEDAYSYAVRRILNLASIENFLADKGQVADAFSGFPWNPQFSIGLSEEAFKQLSSLDPEGRVAIKTRTNFFNQVEIVKDFADFTLRIRNHAVLAFMEDYPDIPRPEVENLFTRYIDILKYGEMMDEALIPESLAFEREEWSNEAYENIMQSEYAEAFKAELAVLEREYIMQQFIDTNHTYPVAEGNASGHIALRIVVDVYAHSDSKELVLVHHGGYARVNSDHPVVNIKRDAYGVRLSDSFIANHYEQIHKISRKVANTILAKVPLA